MLFFLKLFKKIIVMFQSDISADQIAWGFALGAVLGLVPNVFVKTVMFVVIMMFRVNLTSALLAASFFAVIGFAIDPVLDKIGYICLVDISFLKSFYTWLYNLPLVPFTKFNNTVVMGSLAAGIILLAPNAVLAKKMLVYYRANYRDKVSQWKIMKLLGAVINTAKIINKVG